MRERDDERQPSIHGINVTPLVDVSLVLLIVFIVAAGLVTKMRVIPIDLPKTGARATTPTDVVLEVVVAADGAITLDGRPVDEPSLVLAARRARDQAPRARAIVRAAPSVRHGDVIRALDALRRGDVTSIAYARDGAATGRARGPRRARWRWRSRARSGSGRPSS